MTYLGDASLPRRLSDAVRGLFVSPAAASGPAGPVWVIGHRGAAKWAAENTLESFRKALDLGATGIETDVCVTGDSCFVLWHDAEPQESVALARQIGGERYLYAPAVPLLGSPLRKPVVSCETSLFLENYGYVLSEKGLANPFSPRRKPDVPPARLDDLLSWAPHEPRLEHVVLDLKLSAAQAGEAVRLMRLLGDVGTRGNGAPDLVFHLLSTQREVVAALAEDARRDPPPPSVRLTGDYELPGVVRSARRHGLAHVSMGAGQRTWGDFRRELGRVVRARRRGVFRSVVAWTVNEASRLRDLAALGVDGIVTDEPALLSSLVARPGAG